MLQVADGRGTPEYDGQVVDQGGRRLDGDDGSKRMPAVARGLSSSLAGENIDGSNGDQFARTRCGSGLDRNPYHGGINPYIDNRMMPPPATVAARHSVLSSLADDDSEDGTGGGGIARRNSYTGPLDERKLPAIGATRPSSALGDDESFVSDTRSMSNTEDTAGGDGSFQYE